MWGHGRPATPLSINTELVDGDIRSALNTLQFMQRKYGRISKDTLAIAAIGHKDVGKSNFELWTQIFSTPRVVKGLGVSTTGAGGSKVDLAVEYFKQLRLTIDGHGDAVGLLAGCRSNYLTATPRWSTPCTAPGGPRTQPRTAGRRCYGLHPPDRRGG